MVAHRHQDGSLKYQYGSLFILCISYSRICTLLKERLGVSLPEKPLIGPSLNQLKSRRCLLWSLSLRCLLWSLSPPCALLNSRSPPCALLRSRVPKMLSLSRVVIYFYFCLRVWNLYCLKSFLNKGIVWNPLLKSCNLRKVKFATLGKEGEGEWIWSWESRRALSQGYWIEWFFVCASWKMHKFSWIWAIKYCWWVF